MPKKLDPKVAEAVMLKAGLKPLEPYRNGLHNWKTVCQVCREINFRCLKSVVTHKNGCVYCSGKKVNPDKARDWMLKNHLKPLEPYNSKSKGAWRCKCLKCGRIVTPRYKPPKSKKKPACAFCSKVRVDEKEIVIKMKKNGYEPLVPYQNSQTPWKSRCLKCGRIGFPRWSQVQWYNSKCQYCAGNKITEKQAVQVMKSAGYLPLEPYVSSKVKWKSKHIKCGMIVSPKLNTIATGTGGCKNCATIGFEVNKPGYVYFLQHEVFMSYKVGISNIDSKPNRLKTHSKHGWETVRIYKYDSGWDASIIENKFFVWLRKVKKVPPHLLQEDMVQGGWSETFSVTSVSKQQVIRKLNQLNEGLQE